MTITVTHAQLLPAIEALNRLITIKQPPKTAWALSRAARKIETALKDYERVRVGLIEEYGQKDADGRVKTEPETGVVFRDRAGFDKDFGELLDQAVDLDITPIPFDSLGAAEVEPRDLLVLADWLIVDTPAEKDAA